MIMALQHKTYDVHGVQFHPESILTPEGEVIIKTFCCHENLRNPFNKHKNIQMKEILQYLFNHNTLSKSEAKAMMIEIAQNKFNAAEITAFISVFLMRNITLKELEGFREALLQMAVPVKIDTNDAIDIVGTGGDGKRHHQYLNHPGQLCSSRSRTKGNKAWKLRSFHHYWFIECTGRTGISV